jgi:hypothetical protein
MTIIQLKNFLNRFSDDKICLYGFSSPHSYRGYYDQAAVVPTQNVTIAEMKSTLDKLLTDTFEGWKGGEYKYDEDTEIHFSHIGSSEDLGEEMIAIILSVAGFTFDLPILNSDS